VAGGSANPQGFVPDCPIPFAGIAKHRSIDDTCLARGDVPDPPVNQDQAAHTLQNLAKNNFCATGPPALVTFISFKRLQQKLDQKESAAKTWDQQNLPTDRSVFLSVHTTSEGATIGEGTLVTFAGWLKKTRPGGSESCNCDDPDALDVHVVLIRSSDAPECRSVTAEISPHFQPDQWNRDTLKSVRDHPLRFTGQLMYDAAHRPCPHKHSTDPSRVSSWEIHPVYAIDVCTKKSLSSCKADNNDRAVWVPLDQWHGDE
jgi:hypothetical protein